MPHFDRFTDRARMAMGLARQEAQRLQHGYIGTEHVLLGLLQERSGVAASVLKELDIDADTARVAVEKIVDRGDVPTPDGEIPFTPRAKRVFELSQHEAVELGHAYIGTEHLLLGLLEEGGGVAAQVLRTLGAEFEALRIATLDVITADGTDAPAGEATESLGASHHDTGDDLDREIAAAEREKAEAIAAEDFRRAARLRDRATTLRRERARRGPQGPAPDALRRAASVASGAAKILQNAARELQALEGQVPPAARHSRPPDAEALEALALVLRRHPDALGRLLAIFRIPETEFVSALLEELRRIAEEAPGEDTTREGSDRQTPPSREVRGI